MKKSPFTFQAGEGQLDPFFTTMAVAERTRLAMQTFDEEAGAPGGAVSPSATRLGKFFKESYRVGAEKLARDIPPPILMELLGHALIVVRNCVLNVFPPAQAERIRRNLLYRIGLSVPLTLFYNAAVLSRRASKWTIALWAIIPIVSFVTLAIAAIWWNQLLYSDGFHWKTILILVVLPLVLLVIEGGSLLWMTRLRYRHTSA